MKSQQLFREVYINNTTDIHEREIIPFYDNTSNVEISVYNFLKSDPPECKARIMTLFDSPGTGKTRLLNNLPMIFENVFRIAVPIRRIQSRIITRKNEYKLVWGDIVTAATQSVRLLNSTTKSVSIDQVPRNLNEDSFDWSDLSNAVREQLGENALVYLHIDAFQVIFNSDLLRALYSLVPCSKNVKMIVSGTSALGNDAIKGLCEFDSIACPPLKSFGHERVYLILNKILHWDELKFEEKTKDECKEIKREIEKALIGTPKCILYFLQACPIALPKGLKDTDIYNILERAYSKYSENLTKLLNQLLEIGKEYSKIEETNLFEKIQLIFSFPEDFGLERKGDVLFGDSNNEAIKLLMPFNHSGLVRIYKESNLIFLSIPDNFTKRFIQEHTLYFPKEWIAITYSSMCDIAKNVSGNVKGCGIKIWLALVLLNQHSILFERISETMKQQTDMEILKIYYEDNVKRNTFTTFEQLLEDIVIDGPKIAHDAKDNSCVDVIIPIQVRYLHKSRAQQEVVPLFIQITSMKNQVSQHALKFFNRVTTCANSFDANKRDWFDSCMAVFLTVHPLDAGKEADSVNQYLAKNRNFLLIDLDSSNIFKDIGYDSVTDTDFLQKRIQKSNLFMNITNSRNQSENWEGKSLSPYNSRTSKKQKVSNI